MHETIRKLPPTIALLLFFICIPSQLTNASDKAAVSAACGAAFTKIADPALYLFEAGQDHVLRVEFDKKGHLTEFAVEPKYYFEEERRSSKSTNGGNEHPLSGLMSIFCDRI
jgi:hypothetical protein